MRDRPIAGSLLGAHVPRLIELWRTGHDLRLYPEYAGKLSRREAETAGAALLALQRGLTGGRILAGTGYMNEGDLLGAYLLYYWPVSYMQVSLALAESPCSPRRVLDLGSGPGPASAAVIDALVGNGGALDELVLVDSSRKSLDLAASLLGRVPGGPASLRTVELDLESEAELPKGPFDLIVIGHCLNELWAHEAEALERRTELVERAAARLAPGGRVLIVEPALLATCRGLIGLRDRLASRSWRVLGPCPGSYPCPALAAGPERSCHAESPWKSPESVASLASAAGLDRNSVKFAYFFLAPESVLSGEPDEAPSGDRRVVSEPMLNKAGRLRYVLCGAGRLETISGSAGDDDLRAKGFMDLRRGDVVRPRGLESRPGGGFGLVPASELDLRARAPEASP
jgi:SAM-dependent methyltransferase